MSGTVAVRVPTILRAYTEGESDVGVPVPDGATLADVVAALEAAYPGIAGRVVDDTGRIRRFVNVYVNDEDIRYLGRLDARLEPDDTVSILPAVAGGSR